MSSVGRNIPHDSARGHVTGESIYIDDMPPLPGELLVDFVWSPFAHARIRSIDFADAATLPGVVALYTYRDLHHNPLGPIMQGRAAAGRGGLHVPRAADRGHRRGVARGDRSRRRRPSHRLEELTPILTIDDAIAAQSFIGEPRTSAAATPTRLWPRRSTSSKGCS